MEKFQTKRVKTEETEESKSSNLKDLFKITPEDLKEDDFKPKFTEIANHILNNCILVANK